MCTCAKPRPSMLSLCCPTTLYPHQRPPSHASSPKNNYIRARKPTTSSEFSVLLESCIKSRSLDRGRRLHLQIKEAGFEKNRDLLPRLIKLYSVCGCIKEARKLFDRIPNRSLDVYAWTALISAYIKNESPGEALELFCEMLEFGISPDSHTFSALLKVSADLGFRHLAIQLHSITVKCGYCSALSVGNSLIHAYGSFSDVDGARRIFDRMPVRDVVLWSSMIKTCSRGEQYAESMKLFSRMQLQECLKPNEVTIVSLLPACSFFSFLRRGQAIHAYAIRNGFDSNLIVRSSLVTMYSRCGHPDNAFMLFNRLKEQNIILWTSMIEGFSINGRFDLALNLFNTMQVRGWKPNYITLVVILSACSHGGFVDEGLEIFYSMRKKFGIEPREEHYACVVGMLGRGGRLDEAEKFIGRMTIKPSGSIFGSLLGACQLHQNVELGKRLAHKLFELEPNNAANYVILSNLYASIGSWDDVGRVRNLMAAKGLSKSSGCSWIEIKDEVHVFGAHDRSHAESDSIYKMLGELGELIVSAGYVLSTKYVLLDLEEDDKKMFLCSHSERLAIAFGLLKAPPTVPIRIAKNLRVCGDCHHAIKLISKVTSRQLVIRDTNRFHLFSQGSCSCGDYW